MSETPEYTINTTHLPVLDPLDMLPDDERRLILAWRQAQTECRNGTPFIGAARVRGEMLLWSGMGAGKVVLR